MTTCRWGDVVLVRFPYSDLSRFRKRPALVVQDEQVETGLSQRLVCQITSNLTRCGVMRVLVRKEAPAGRTMGLRTDSMIAADNIATVLPRHIDRVIGQCPIMLQVSEALRRVLRL